MRDLASPQMLYLEDKKNFNRSVCGKQNIRSMRIVFENYLPTQSNDSHRNAKEWKY